MSEFIVLEKWGTEEEKREREKEKGERKGKNGGKEGWRDGGEEGGKEAGEREERKEGGTWLLHVYKLYLPSTSILKLGACFN